MRKFSQRPELPHTTKLKLREKTEEILQSPIDNGSRKERAARVYKASRQTDWFQPVVNALRGLCGVGELCMYCSSNEPSQVEHFRPLSVFPERAMEYENYLWSCDICNRTHKGERFPPDTEPGETILNPLDGDVWEHFFIEEQFGRLLCRVDPLTHQPLPRALVTCDVVGIDRETVQTKRTRRYRNLRRDAQRTLSEFQAGALNVLALKNEISEWLSEPFQADVADYFLNGPGRSKEPFRALLLAAESD